jgi:glycosyltransferase involved in cell wall biosynthesis
VLQSIVPRPLVSVVIPTHNRAALLERAIQSARDAGANAQVTVVDDASTDDTPKLCSKIDGINYLRFPKNLGLSAARNAGIINSASEYIAFLDDDDLRLPETLGVQLRTLDANPGAAFCYGRFLIGAARRQLPTGEVFPERLASGDVFWELLETNFIPMPTVVARKAALIEHGLFNTELTAVEDWDMWLRLSERCPVVAVEDPVAIYRRADHESGQMSRDVAGILRIQLGVQEGALKLARARAATHARRRKARRTLIANAHLTMVQYAAKAMAEGDAKSARDKMRQAFGFRPLRTVLSGRSWMMLAQR